MEQLADGLLQELGEREDAATAKLLALRGSAVLAAWDDFDGARGDGERALALARRAGDPDAELEALQLADLLHGGCDELEGQRWAEIESLARARGRWELAAAQCVRRLASLVGDEPERDARPKLERAAELAEARGLVDETAWVDYDRTEAHLAAGSWDDALEVGLRAIETAEEPSPPSHGCSHLVRPAADRRARGRGDLIERAFPVFEGSAARAESPYARVIVAAMDLAFAEAGLQPSFVPELEPRLVSFDLGYGDPSWIAALEAVVGSWLDAGALADARTALDRLRASTEGRRLSQLARASQALMRSRLLLAEGDPSAAAAEAERALDTRAPWWRSRALRALAATGAAHSRGARRGSCARAVARDRVLPVDSAPWPGTC